MQLLKDNNFKIKIYLLFALAILIVIINYFIFTVSYQPLNAISSIIICELFFFLMLVVLSNSRNIINVFFAFSLLILALAMLVVASGYILIELRELWKYATFFLIIGPLGIYTSAELINDGLQNQKHFEIMLFWAFIFFLAITGLLMYDLRQPGINLLYGDGILVFLALSIIGEFRKIRKTSPDLEKRLNFLIASMSLMIIGLVTNLIIFFITGENTVIRLGFTVIGMISMVIAFTHVAHQQIDEIETEMEDHLDLTEIVQSLEDAIQHLEGELIIPQYSSNQSPTTITPKKQQKFYNDLSSKMNGTMITILIECTLEFPNLLTGSSLEKKLKKSKMVIHRNKEKLIELGYLREVSNLHDNRTKPVALSDKGFLFLYFLQQKLTKYLSKEENLSFLSLNFIKHDFKFD